MRRLIVKRNTYIVCSESSRCSSTGNWGDVTCIYTTQNALDGFVWNLKNHHRFAVSADEMTEKPGDEYLALDRTTSSWRTSFVNATADRKCAQKKQLPVDHRRLFAISVCWADSSRRHILVILQFLRVTDSRSQVYVKWRTTVCLRCAKPIWRGRRARNGRERETKRKIRK